ncbi:MAG: hypothetical protein CBC35_07170 [Planctomycetes bacterium TMED75]|nr:hypothetical protein [Planctomycetaceae bacterium]OUU92485.1 MAG: hypothetical protein CBC35_07170 [Planctomycetes bacterium TMED75]
MTNKKEHVEAAHNSNTTSWARWLGVLGLAAAVFASLMLSLVALSIIKTLPGCGPSSGCDKVTSGVWGSIPGLNWPVSFIGLAYFVGLLVAWLKAAPSRNLLLIMRFGMLCSIGFVVIMVSEGSFCRWCVVSHAGNLVAWLCAEWILRGSRSSNSEGGRTAAVSFCVVTVVLAILLPIRNAQESNRNARELAKNQSEIAAGPANTESLSKLETSNVIGPADAAVKVVLFTDYQCPDCKKTENLLTQVARQRDDMSIAIKHYPYCMDCNPKANFTSHPNACWAARAAEAAMIIGGPEAFEKMHNWLFEVKGAFTKDQLEQALNRMGFDPASFNEIMTSDAVLADIQQDCVDGYDLGIFYTPMMFINGVEYKWYYGGGDINSVRRTVDIAAKSNQNSIVPASRSQKLFEDWKSGRKRGTPGNALESWRGTGPVEIVIFADYQHDSAKQADQIMRTMLEKGMPIRYAWRHAPFEYRGENPWLVEDSKNLARGVEAARELGGDEARWKAHDWVISNGGRLNRAQIAQGIASATGLPEGSLLEKMGSDKLRNKLLKDANEKNRTWRSHSPLVLIEERNVPRWRDPTIDSQGFLEAIVNSAREEQMQKQPAGSSG